jgi:AcrR family transcriptional regulator
VTTSSGSASGNRARSRNPVGEGNRLRDELLAAAGRLLAAKGDPEAVTLRAVAREAGIAAPSVYLQFADRDALLQAVFVEHFAEFQQAIEAAGAASDDPAQRLLRGCLAYLRFAEERPGSYRVIFETTYPRWPELTTAELPGMAAFQVLVDGVAACITAGQARPGDSFQIATDIWVAMHGMVSLRQRLSAFPWPAMEQQLIGILHALAGVPVGELIVKGEKP